MSMYQTLKDLCSVQGIPGREAGIAEFIKTKISPLVDECYRDALGNLIATKHGKVGEKKIMLCAHMDEIGFIVNFIEDNGMLRVATMGGISFLASTYTKVISDNGTVGVLVPEGGTKPADLGADKVYIDIGAKNKKDAERHIRIGDAFAVAPTLFRLCGKRVAGRPLDDRVGCAILLDIAEKLKDTVLDATVSYVFAVQEEVGCRGSVTATYALAPTDALCFDVTGTGDTPGSSPMACALGDGAAIKIKDSSVICHPEVVAKLHELAKEHKIKAQNEILTYGGTDTSSMQRTGAGSRAGAISIPTRYIHSGVECCDLGDVEACVELAHQYVLSIG